MDLSALIRFSQVMPNKDAPFDLRILKAHLLAEEALNNFLESTLPRGELITNSRTPFSEKLKIAKAITNKESLDWVWEAYTKLNSIRNSYAHKIEDEKRDTKLESFLESCRNHPQWHDLAEQDDELTVGIFITCLELGLSNVLHDSLRIVR